MIRIFISSVQKELAQERAAIAQLVAVDPFLLQHCEAVLYDQQPSTGKPDRKAYLAELKSCAVYLLLLDVEYGRQGTGEISATHEEYRLAQRLEMPTLVFIKGLDGKKDAARETKTRDFIGEIKNAGHKYVRFHDREDLKPAIRDALCNVLAKSFQISATREETEEADHQIEMASPFETALMPDATCAALEREAVSSLIEAVIPKPGLRIWDEAPEHALVTRGLAVCRGDGPAVVNRAAFLLFAPNPASRFPQCEILADAYDEPRISGRPKGQETIDAPLLFAVEQAMKFVDHHTFHPRRVVGINNIRLTEYPPKALREALVNAIAHRNYDDATRKIIIRVFSDRIEIASPGYPLKPLTLAKLRRGNYRPCSRNPLITQTLALLGQMEQRGTGFARMRDAMLDHGLDEPSFATQDGYFIVTLPGPNGDYDRISVPQGSAGLITPAMEARLNERQKKIMVEVQQNGSVTSGWCRKSLKVSYDTANRDLLELVEFKLLIRQGSGRASSFAIPPDSTHV